MVGGFADMSKTEHVKSYADSARTSVIPVVTKGIGGTVAGSGANTQITSDVYTRSAKAFTFNAGMLVDFQTPQFNANSQQILLQTKNYNLKTFNTQTACINNWIRAQNINVNQAGYTYTYSEQEHKTASPLFLQQNSKAYQYSDYLKIQVGQTSALPISSIPLGNNYGKLDIGVIKDILFESKEGSIKLSSSNALSLISDSFLKMKGTGITISGSSGGIVKTIGELAFSTTGPMLFASDAALVLNTTSVMYLDAAVVVIGSSGFYKGLVDLDSNITEAIIESVGFESIDSLSSIGSTLSSQVSSALGAFSPGNLQSTISSALDIEGLTGNVLGSTISDMLSNNDYSDFINNLIPSSVLDSVLPVIGSSFDFQDYPDIKGIDPYTDANLNKPTSSAAAGGYSIPNATIKQEPYV